MSKRNFLRTEVNGAVGILNLDAVVAVHVYTEPYGDQSTYVRADTVSHELDGSGGSYAYEWRLFQGDEDACVTYIDWLCEQVDVLVYPTPDVEVAENLTTFVLSALHRYNTVGVTNVNYFALLCDVRKEYQIDPIALGNQLRESVRELSTKGLIVVTGDAAGPVFNTKLVHLRLADVDRTELTRYAIRDIVATLDILHGQGKTEVPWHKLEELWNIPHGARRALAVDWLRVNGFITEAVYEYVDGKPRVLSLLDGAVDAFRVYDLMHTNNAIAKSVPYEAVLGWYRDEFDIAESDLRPVVGEAIRKLLNSAVIISEEIDARAYYRIESTYPEEITNVTEED